MVADFSVPLIRGFRHRLRTRVSEHPAMYLPFARHKYPGPSPQVINPRTELVIDGFTRSATTYAVYALQLSQDTPVRLAHHVHAPAQFIEAARRQIPAMVLIREPQGAILSQLTREPGVRLRDALIAYSRFYTCLVPYRDTFVVGEFDEVIHDFGRVVRRLNQRFGTTFVEFVNTEPARHEVLELTRLRGTFSRTLLGFESGEVTRDQLRQELESLPPGVKALEATDAWVPSEDRERAKLALGQRWLDPTLTRLRERAHQVYQAFVDLT